MSVHRRANRPLLLPLTLIAVAGTASAFLVNDTICPVPAPPAVGRTLALRRNPLFYLLGVAIASNISSTAAITGNPQNVLISSFPGLSYAAFAARPAPIGSIGLAALAGLPVAMHGASSAAGGQWSPLRRTPDHGEDI